MVIWTNNEKHQMISTFDFIFHSNLMKEEFLFDKMFVKKKSIFRINSHWPYWLQSRQSNPIQQGNRHQVRLFLLLFAWWNCTCLLTQCEQFCCNVWLSQFKKLKEKKMFWWPSTARYLNRHIYLWLSNLLRFWLHLHFIITEKLKS